MTSSGSGLIRLTRFLACWLACLLCLLCLLACSEAGRAVLACCRELQRHRSCSHGASNSRRTPRLVLEAAPRATSVPRSLHLRRGAGLHVHSVPAQATLLVHGHDPSLARSLACSLASSLARWHSRSWLLACCYAPRHAAELLPRVPLLLLPPFPTHASKSFSSHTTPTSPSP